jgi:hypothetical protein
MKELYQRRLFVHNGSVEQVILQFPEVSKVQFIRVWIPNSIEILKNNSFKDSRKLSPLDLNQIHD